MLALSTQAGEIYFALFGINLTSKESQALITPFMENHRNFISLLSVLVSLFFLAAIFNRLYAMITKILWTPPEHDVSVESNFSFWDIF